MYIKRYEHRIQSSTSNRVRRFLITVIILISILGIPPGQKVEAATTITFSAEEFLGKPTDTSIAVNILPVSTIEYHYQVGTVSGVYDDLLQTPTVTATGGQPHELTITGLEANTRYFYRMRYHLPGETDWIVRTEHSFMTQRAAGDTFVFVVTSDSHNATSSSTSFVQAMQNINSDQPDFVLDLGDTFFAEYTRNSGIQANVNNAYLDYRASTHFGAFGHSAPIFLSSGNHEEEEGWNLDDSYSRGVADIQARKLFYPTPIDEGEGGFYTGNTNPLAAIDETTYGDEMREDYYAWEWGDALFVVIDPFQYTMVLPYSPIAGEESDETVTTTDQWTWTLGEQQYNWLKDTLENSNAKYKFMFSHQMVGGIPDNSVSGGAGYVRGGAEAAGYFEWGGKNFNGSEGFAANRPSWYAPIHQLMVENGVSAYFHGHDHQYVYETRDGIVYQEVPSPSMSGSGFPGIYAEGDFGDYQTIEMLPSSGHLRLTVAPAQTTVEYVRSGTNNGTVSYTYTIEPNTPSEDYLGDVNHDSFVNSTDALIVLSADADINVSSYCPMNCGDVNSDGLVNSTDALVILSFDAGMSVPFPVEQLGCPASITPPAGCD
jgi:hypothetical protein